MTDGRYVGVPAYKLGRKRRDGTVSLLWYGAVLDRSQGHVETVKVCDHDHRKQETAQRCGEKMARKIPV